MKLSTLVTTGLIAISTLIPTNAQANPAQLERYKELLELTELAPHIQTTSECNSLMTAQVNLVREIAKNATNEKERTLMMEAEVVALTGMLECPLYDTRRLGELKPVNFKPSPEQVWTVTK